MSRVVGALASMWSVAILRAAFRCHKGGWFLGRFEVVPNSLITLLKDRVTNDPKTLKNRLLKLVNDILGRTPLVRSFT